MGFAKLASGIERCDLRVHVPWGETKDCVVVIEIHHT